ncbi:MAG TPA: carboxylesterase family protein [Anaeromyxobacteraceae bacterium]|nr:carboxylesterase family protein [Anaeromyxobacteraceae bacterium]
MPDPAPERLLRSLPFLALIASLACASVPVREGAAGPVVVTDLGAVRGVEREGALEFRGIPYAAPPVGELRFAPPRPASPWTSVRDASSFGASCPQTHRYGLTERSTTEDCLFLNVSAPADRRPGERLPVLVWIHGGAFVGGSSSLYRLDRLAARGRLVVVSMNYRVGLLGFMAVKGLDADANGDLGLEDQRLALRWVQRNVAAFGGDPGNVTVAGESAGAGSVCMHLVSPDRVTGLFHKAVVQSAGCLQPMPTVAASIDDSDPSSPPAWKKVAERVGCGSAADAVACLRAAPVASLLDAQDAVSSGVMSFGPSVGNGTVPAQARDAIRDGKVARVPLLMGGTRDELRLYVAYAKLFSPFVADYAEAKLRSFWLPAYYGADAPDPSTAGRTRHDAIVAEYVRGGAMDGASLGSMLSDHQTAVGITNCLYLRSSDALLGLVPALYQFEFADPAAPVLGVGIAKGMDPGFPLGAVHSSELNYLFPRLSNTSAIDGPELEPASQALADRMVDAWAAFAATGAPRAAGLPPWPRYAGGGRDVMLLAPGASGAYDAGERHRCAFWQRVYP